uniref:Secreted protein n=1 Tax=Syphacia muris TaxID=451379 RepID=A0A0N5ASQ8_9BILA
MFVELVVELFGERSILITTAAVTVDYCIMLYFDLRVMDDDDDVYCMQSVLLSYFLSPPPAVFGENRARAENRSSYKLMLNRSRVVSRAAAAAAAT